MSFIKYLASRITQCECAMYVCMYVVTYKIKTDLLLTRNSELQRCSISLRKNDVVSFWELFCFGLFPIFHYLQVQWTVSKL